MTPLEVVFTRAWPTRSGAKTNPPARSAGGPPGFFAARDRINNLIFPSNQDSQSAGLEATTAFSATGPTTSARGSTLGGSIPGAPETIITTGMPAADGHGWETNQITFQFLRRRIRTAWPRRAQPGDASGGTPNLSTLHLSRNWLYAARYETISPDFRADSAFLYADVDTKEIDLEVDTFLYGV